MSDILSLFSLQGKVAVVAGASRGIGHAIANGLVDAGARVVGFGRSDAAANARFDYRRCDVCAPAAVAGLFDDVEAEFGAIDVYLHVAGITLPSQGGMQSSETFNATLASNLSSAYDCCANAGRRMAARGQGSIITVTSIGSLMAFPNNPAYVAAKGGLRMMSKALALDLGPSQVRVNCLVPGYVQTAMTAASHADPVLHEQRAGHTMLGRWGQPEDLVGAAIFLASPASKYVTGTDLIVDGGWTAKGL